MLTQKNLLELRRESAEVDSGSSDEVYPLYMVEGLDQCYLCDADGMEPDAIIRAIGINGRVFIVSAEFI